MKIACLNTFDIVRSQRVHVSFKGETLSEDVTEFFGQRLLTDKNPLS